MKLIENGEKEKLYNHTLSKIQDLLLATDEKLGEEKSLSILASILRDYDLQTASNLVKANCEPSITKNRFEDKHFDEGNEESGFISLSSLLNDIETVLNCDDYSSDIKFTDFIRLETEEEMEENGHGSNVGWFTTDSSHLIKDTYIGFEDVN